MSGHLSSRSGYRHERDNAAKARAKVCAFFVSARVADDQKARLPARGSSRGPVLTLLQAQSRLSGTAPRTTPDICAVRFFATLLT
jgi:hypothetical protein